MIKFDGGYLGYIHDCEKQELIKKCINHAKYLIDIGETDIYINDIAKTVGLNFNSLTSVDKDYIAKELENYGS